MPSANSKGKPDAVKSGPLKEKILKQGAVGFLHKPFHIEELFHIINQVFNGTEDRS